MSDIDPGRRLRQLFDLFADTQFVEFPQFEIVPADKVPEPSHELLVHNQHMTVTLERFHGRRVQLQVLARRHHGNDYGRMILLSLEGPGEIVEFGMFRMDLSCCDADVQAAIIAGQTPLGRVLIEHNVLRQIDPTAFLRITNSAAMSKWFDIDPSEPIFGRLAIISCNGQRTVELLEVVRPAKAGK